MSKIDQVATSGGDSGFRGVTLQKDETSGSIISLTTSARRAEDRWDATTPSFVEFPHLENLTLYKCRYIENVHGSLVQLKHLKTLRLTRCNRLKSLPDAIGQLENLEEVIFNITFSCFSTMFRDFCLTHHILIPYSLTVSWISRILSRLLHFLTL